MHYGATPSISSGRIYVVLAQGSRAVVEVGVKKIIDNNSENNHVNNRHGSK